MKHSFGIFEAPCYGEAILTRGESARLQNDRVKSILIAFGQQTLEGSAFNFAWYRGWCGIVNITILSLIIVLCGAVSLGFGSSYFEQRIEYARVSPTLRFKFDPRFAERGPIEVFYDIHKFFGNYKDMVLSRPGEIWFSYTCGNFETIGDAKSVRPLPPELDETEGVDNSSTLWPCGLASYTFFNDKAVITNLYTGQPLNLEQAQAESEKFITFAVLPNEEQDVQWRNAWEHDYRIWFAPPLTPAFRKRFAVITEEIDPNAEYSLQMHSAWPAETWDARTFLVFAHLSPIGSEQWIVGGIITAWGGLTLCLAGVLGLVYGCNKEKYKPSSSREDHPAAASDAKAEEAATPVTAASP